MKFEVNSGENVDCGLLLCDTVIYFGDWGDTFLQRLVTNCAFNERETRYSVRLVASRRTTRHNVPAYHSLRPRVLPPPKRKSEVLQVSSLDWGMDVGRLQHQLVWSLQSFWQLYLSTVTWRRTVGLRMFSFDTGWWVLASSSTLLLLQCYPSYTV